MNVYNNIVTNARRHVITLGVAAAIIVGLVLAIVGWPKTPSERAASSCSWWHRASIASSRNGNFAVAVHPRLKPPLTLSLELLHTPIDCLPDLERPEF
jgi:hypothetical protein